MSVKIEPVSVDITALGEGDRIAIAFNPPLHDPDIGDITKATGIITKIVGRSYLHADSHRTAWQMPACLDLQDAHIHSCEILARADDIAAEKASRSRGDIVFPDPPSNPAELQDQLDELALMISREEDRCSLDSRHDQLKKQFDDVADIVSLAQTKRAYVLTRAIVGADFHPWLTSDPRVFRIGTVRPLPTDFEFDRGARMDRVRRLEEAVRIFGEAERETRKLASHLRSLGYDVRRPHPNAQSLYIRVSEGRASSDLHVAPSSNGLWGAMPTVPDNKTKALAQKRVLAAGHLNTLKAVVTDYQNQ